MATSFAQPATGRTQRARPEPGSFASKSMRYCIRRARPGGMLPPRQPVLRPWLQPGGVLAPAKPRRVPDLLNPLGIPVLLNWRPLLKLRVLLYPRADPMPLNPEPPLKACGPAKPPPIPPPPPPPPRAKAGTVIATPTPSAIASATLLSRLFMAASSSRNPWRRNGVGGNFVPLGRCGLREANRWRSFYM